MFVGLSASLLFETIQQISIKYGIFDLLQK